MSPKKNRKPNADAQPASPDLSAIAELCYEDAVARLEELIDQIESGELGLEESVAAYEEGMALRRHCEAIQARAEQRVRELSADDEAGRGGGPIAESGGAPPSAADDEADDEG